MKAQFLFAKYFIHATVFCFLMCCATSLAKRRSTRNKVANEEVQAHVGDTVALPCRVDTSQCGELHSVKWYRDASRIYVFSQVGGIARAEGDATERMSVEYAPNGAEALLKISPVEVLDEASYKCEITYLEVRENCDVVQIVKLTTLVRPESVRILGVDGVSMANASMLGPHNEGTKVEIICEAIGGRPIPKVTWYNDSQELDGLYSSHDNGDGLGTGTSKLQIKLSRGDLGAKLECKVESTALDEPTVSWMMIDVNVRPTKLELTGFKEHVVQGSNVLLNCDIFGARPAANVRWYNGTTEITTVESYPEETRDGTFTTKSSLTFVANRWHNGNAIHCYAENSVKRDMNEPSLHDLVLIEVFYPPVVTVKPTNITTNETGDLLLLCEYIANPMKLDNVLWTKNGKNLTLTNDKYYGGTWDNPPLTIKNISRDDLGEYTCIAKNIVGSQQSDDSIFMNVLFPPSVEVIMIPAYSVKAKDKENVTMQCSALVGNPPELFKVRWFLGGQLLKELPECNYTNQDEYGNVEGSGGQLCDEFDPEIMSLLRVTEDFAGNYTCQATNIAGWGPVSEPQELVVYYAPSPAKLRYTPNKVIKGGSVTLECSVQHPGRPENVSYLWYRGSYAMHEITTSNWTISPVLLETKSNFSCMAVNEGGIGEAASVFIDVSAPPSFIQNLAPYQGVLMNSKNISLTCRVECSPVCSITWFKDGKLMNMQKNPLYYVKTAKFPPDFRKNDFESIESVLVWNMTAWNDEQLDRTAANSNYTCQSSANGIGPGVNSIIEIAVDYPPENLTVSNKVISVVENHRPERVFCSGKGHPALTYSWRRDGLAAAEVLSKTHILNLGAVSRAGSGKYVCEAANRHGTETISAYLNVQFAPGCTIETVELDGAAALECTAIANPQEVTFTWKVKGENDTVEGALLVAKGLKGYLKLDATVDSFRTYQCYVNNTVGVSAPCERDVTAYQEQSSQIGIPGVAPWWKQLTNENMLIIMAIIIAIVICVIIVCIIIIMICRRRRANSKYSNAVELEEREKPDGQSPDTSNSRWPLKPGVLVHLNKMRDLSGNHLETSVTTRLKPYKTTSVKTSSPEDDSNNKDNDPNGQSHPRVVDTSNVTAPTSLDLTNVRKTTGVNRKPYNGYRRRGYGDSMYARLIEGLKRFIGQEQDDSDDRMPFGVYRGSRGVVTFKKLKAASGAQPSADISTVTSPASLASVSRKRKKPGLPPNPSSIPDKGNLGSAPPGGNLADPSTGPDNKGFYENLPFHGMQTPPDKPISIISSITGVRPHQSNQTNLSHATRKLKQNHLDPPSLFASPKNSFNAKKVQRHQSFHGFQNNQFIQHNVTPFRCSFLPYPGFYPMMHHFSAQNVNFYNPHNNPFINPAFFYNMPKTLQQASIRTNPQVNPLNYYQRVQSHNNLYNQNMFYGYPQMFPNYNQLHASRSRFMGRSEFDIRRTASGINVATTSDTYQINKVRKCESEKRFNSLDIKKHKCYSPTFYSMRCKKHCKKQPVVYAVPKKLLSNLSAENLETALKGNNEVIQPKPAPRCKKHQQKLNDDIVYTDVNHTEFSVNNASKEIVTADVHQKDITSTSQKSALEIFTFTPLSSFKPFEPRTISLNSTNKPSVCDLTPKSATLISKPPPLQNTACQKQVPNLKVPPTVKSSPTIAAPNTPTPQERKSPKGALNQQLQAKLKQSPMLANAKSGVSPNIPKQSLNDSLEKNRTNASALNDSKNITKDSSDLNDTPLIPMNIMEMSKTQSLLHSSPASKNAFYTLTTPHLKQLTSGHNITQHYTTQNELLLQQQQQYEQYQQQQHDQYQQYQQQYSTLPHSTTMGGKHMQKLLPRALFQDQYQQQQQQMMNHASQGQPLGKSKSFCSKTAKPSNKKHFQIPLQKCHSFKFQTAESYFQPIKNIHEEHYMRNGYVSDLGPNYPESKTSQPSHSSSQATTNNNRKKKNKHSRQNKHLQATTANSPQPESIDTVKLQHPKPQLPPTFGKTKKPNGVVYADLDMSPSKHGKNGTDNHAGDHQQVVDGTTSLNGDQQNTTLQKQKAKTEYATLKFNDVGQEIDV